MADDNVIPLFAAQEAIERAERRLISGGGDGTSGGMEARLANLEKRFDRFEGLLDSVARDIAELKGRTGELPKGSDVTKLSTEIGELRGNINGLPTFKSLGILTAIVAALVAAMPKIWDWLDRTFPSY
jgi:hypothetical protein